LLANCVGVPIFPLRLPDPLCAFLEIHHSTLFHAKAQSKGEGAKKHEIQRYTDGFLVVAPN
jgi:hypothetical protein